MKRRAILVLLTLALLCVLAVSVSAAPTDPAVLNTVYDKAVQMTTDKVFDNADENGQVTATCPYCNEPATWIPLPEITTATAVSGHYYLQGDRNNTSYYQTGGAKTCIHLNGHNIKNSGNVAAALWIKAKQELNVMGDGTITGLGTTRAGVLYVLGTARLFGGTFNRTAGSAYTASTSADNAVLEVYTGTTINGKSAGGSTIVNGYGSATLKLYGGTINASSGTNGGTAIYLTAGTTYLAGANINSNGGRGVYLPSGSATVHQSAGSITGATKCNVYMEGGTGTYNLSGGSISGGNSSSYNGANVRVKAGQFNMTGGSITGGTITVTDSTTTATSGGNVYVYGTGAFTMTGGEISGGSADLGGNVYLNSADATFTLAPNTSDSSVKPLISGGTATTAGGSVYVTAGTLAVNAGSITGGEAPNGGSVYNEAGTLTVAGGTISGGTADTAGGSIYLNGGTLDVTGGTISGGTAPSGGNVYVNGGTLTVNGGTITKGTANRAWHTSQWYYYGGGNIYVSDSSAAKANILSGTVSAGTATSNCGGNILCRGKGTLTVSGGTVSGGKSGYPGANIANGASANVTISGGTISGGNGDTMNRWNWDGDNVFAFGGTTTVSGGTIESDGKTQGNGILAWFNAKIVLDGNAMVTTAGKFGNIYIGKQSGTATLQVNNTFKGEAGVAFDAEHGVAYGATLALDSSTGAYTGNVYLEDLDNPSIFGTQENALVVAGTKVNDTWYQNNETAVAAATATDVIKLYTAADLDLQGAEYLVDLNGKSVNITGTGNVTCFDTVNLDFQNFGTATVNGPTLVNTVVTTQDGIRYYTISDENAHSFHALQAKVSSVSVRPSSAGVYYSCTWNCDSTLLEKLNITAYGVALSVKEMPVDGFTKDGHTLYTKVTEALVPNVKRNSVLVDKIFKTGENVDNNGRAQMPIFAVPYIEVNGETFVGTGVQYSLKNILEDLLDQEDVYFANREALENFYKTWETVMSGWDLSFIGKFPMNASDDGVLRFFLMGNSFTYYYVEELYTLLAANKPDGVDEIEIYNLYHSGSALKDHVEWWQNDAAEYEFYLTTGSDDEDAVYKRAYVNADKKWWTLDEALVTANWDYIGVQPSTTGLNIGYASAIGKSNEEMEEHLAAAFPYIETLMNHLYGYFPNVKFMWQRSWAPEIGRVSGSTTYTKESRDNYSIGLQRIQDYLTNVWDLDKPYDLIQVNCGAAWDEARALNDALETKLIPEVGGLCARLGVVNTGTYPPGEGYTNPGDGYHEGDIGGGQLLNAYVWYMTIMQTLDPDYTPDVSGSTYVPDYTRGHILKVEFVELLKNAAMSVFETAE